MGIANYGKQEPVALLIDIIFLWVGYYFVSHRQKIAQRSIEQQNKLFRFSFKNWDSRVTEVIVLIIGLYFLLSSMLSLFQRLRFGGG